MEDLAMALTRDAVRSRRSVITAAVAGIAAAATATLTTAQRVLAQGDDGSVLHVADRYTAIYSHTELAQSSMSNAENVLVVIGNDTPLYSFGVTGVSGESYSNAGVGVLGVGPYVAVKGASSATGATNGSGVGVFGTSKSSDGAGVDGRSPNVGVHGKSAGTGVFGEGTSGGDGVRGSSTGGGTGVLANTDTGRALVAVASASTGTTVGAMGESFSHAGTGVRGWASGGGTGVYGFSGGVFPSGNAPSKTGVYGNAPNGRGVVAAGGVAQVRLVPSASSNHPANGALGDLFLDSRGRLWFCKGDANWKQVAFV
jgi:hypothetical protein